MKTCLLLLIILFFSACKDSPSSFEKASCIEEGQSYRVFKPCRQYIFNAEFWDAEFNLISESRIWMMATGKPWDVQPELQSELAIQYEYHDQKVDEIVMVSVNQDFIGRPWKKKEVTGIIENDGSIWMHPFRSNQYGFTEVAPFPEVRTPLAIGKSWSGSLHIYEGWGDWSNVTLNDYYEVVSYEQVELPYKTLDAWQINSFTEAPFGNSTHNFWFHPELGFVKMIVKNYAGQILQIELIDVIGN